MKSSTMILNRLKYRRVNPRHENLELVDTSYDSSPFRANSDSSQRALNPNPVHDDAASQKDSLTAYPYSKSWRRPGWRVGAGLAAGSAALALLINVIVTIVVSNAYGLEDGMATLYTGSCGRTETMNTWIHLAINALSTMLLSGSNYCMQCLNAPTRKDIDKAHAKRHWLDIGVPSVRNLGSIDQKKHILWWLLGLSSVPLHLLYNSVFFSAIATTNYNVIYVTDGFVNGVAYNKTMWPDDAGFDGAEIQRSAKSWENFTNVECIDAYANDFISKRRTVLVVTQYPDPEGPEAKGSILAIDPYEFDDDLTSYNPYSWLCPLSNYFDNPCFKQIPDIKNNMDRDGWTSNSYKARYCLSERIDESCSLHFSLPLILVVIVCNLGKFLCMSMVVLWLRSSHPLMTVGDAIDSFMRDNDRFTRGLCLASWHTFAEFESRQQTGTSEPMVWTAKTRRFARAASPVRWIVWTVIFALCMITVILLLAFGIANLKGDKDAQTLWDLGFGGVHPESIITGWRLPTSESGGLASAVLIANLPQPILSFLYLIFNGLCTCMLLAKEWASYGSGSGGERKPLRVSDPRGRQRSTYFLQLPYKFAIPLLVVSGLLHWLVSQSIFLAYITVRDSAGRLLPPDRNVVSCGYSPMAIIFALIVAGGLMLFALLIATRPLNPNMPVAASCSAAISAACHSLPGDDDAPFLPVQWGVVDSDRLRPDEVGHCCFTSEHVTAPIAGRKYAGLGESRIEIGADVNWH